MLEPQRTVSYLSSVYDSNCLREAPCLSAIRSWCVPYDTIKTGVLPSHITRDILLRYSMQHEECALGEKSVPITVCLCSLVNEENDERVPVLMVTCLMDAAGKLVATQASDPWISRALISSGELDGSEFVVCDLDTYRAHQVAMKTLPAVSDWPCAIERAQDFFDAVSTLDQQLSQSEQVRCDQTTCVIWMWDRPNEGACVHATLDRIGEALSAHTYGRLSKPLQDFLGIRDDASGQTNAQELSDDPLLPSKMVCGIPDHLPTLTAQDHEVLSTFAGQDSGDTMVVRAPLGTHGAAVALAAMADMFTECALRGDKAPVMACVGSLDELSHVAQLLSDHPTAGQVAITTRWLPRIATSNVQDGLTSQSRRVLGPLPTLCLMHTADGVTPLLSGQYLTQHAGHLKGGDVRAYGDPWYTPKASIYYLDCVSSFFGERIYDLWDARQRLSEVLRLVDQDRSDLIDAYAGVCKATELLEQRDSLMERIGRLRRGHTICKNRLAFWEELLRTNPVRKSFLSKAEPNQTSLIQQNAQKGEEFAEGKTLIEEICVAYRDEIARIENNIDLMRGATTNLSKRIRDAEPAGQLCTSIIERLAHRCNLTSEQVGILETTIHGRQGEVSSHALDAALDQTIRPAEFWLAVHIYESRWLDISQRRSSTSLESDDLKDTLGIWGTFCPFSLVPQELCESILGSYANSLSERLDLIVLLDAQHADIAHGITLATHTNRLLALGSAMTLGAHVERNQTFDELNTTASHDAELWQDLVSKGLAVSAGRTFFDQLVAHEAMAQLSLADTSESYAELDDIRNTIAPAEQLRTNRVPALASQDDSYALRGIIPPLSYVLVPDSSWGQRGLSRHNPAEAMALIRWLKNHYQEFVGRYAVGGKNPIAILCPFASQSDCIRRLMKADSVLSDASVDVVTLGDAGQRRWPLVLLSSTCGPDAFVRYGQNELCAVLSMAIGAAQDAFVLFCGLAWQRSTNEQVHDVLGSMQQVGRLFSTPRTSRKNPSENTKPKGMAKDELEAKPLSISALLKRLYERGDISKLPPSSAMNKALADRGLIERIKDDEGKAGWQPTQAGREVGILATKDRHSNPFCAYTLASVTVVASIAEQVEQA